MTSNDWYDIKAEAFKLMTGYEAPGIDERPTSMNAYQVHRWQAWATWVSDYRAVLDVLGEICMKDRKPCEDCWFAKDTGQEDHAQTP